MLVIMALIVTINPTPQPLFDYVCNEKGYLWCYPIVDPPTRGTVDFEIEATRTPPAVIDFEFYISR